MNRLFDLKVAFLAGLVLIALGATAMAAETGPNRATATLGGGCFWCVEAVFEEVTGIISAESGYAGGHTKKPDYRSVCDGDTGHAEVVRLVFDPDVISYQEILLIFFGIHDPTTPGRQGADVGPQYRSIVMAHDDDQLAMAKQVIADLEQEKVFEKPIITEVVPASDFWVAEDYHQDYFRRNPEQGYCQAVIAPKLAKFRKQFVERLKGQ